MTSKTIILITILTFLAITVTIVLYLRSNKEPNFNHNTFNRIFPLDVTRTLKTFSLGSNAYYFAGTTSHHIYLGHRTIPEHVVVADKLLEDTIHVQIQSEKIKYKALTVCVDSPFFYLMDGMIPFIYRGIMTDWTAQNIDYDGPRFNEAIPISSQSFILKSMKSYQNVLAKKNLNISDNEFFPNLLEKQIDGIFCTSGMFHYDPEFRRLVYIYYYRNQFVYMDTSLNLLYRGKTIDPVDTAQIKVAKVDSESSFKMAAPPLTVNRKSCISGNWLFINSNLLARNEDKDLFNNSSVIDVYNLKTQSYKFSFHISTHKEKRITSMRVINNRILLVIYGDEIVVYKLNSKLFS